MPVTEKKYPDWVQRYRTRGKTVKKKGDAYYLYKRTSRRVPGKKYPQPVDTYIGIITPDGVVESNKKKISLSDIEVWEYGFTKAIMDLCPASWKKPLGDDWEDILKIIICDWSGRSWLKREGIRDKKDLRCQFDTQASMLNRKIFKEHDLDVKQLFPLKDIYLVIMGKEKALSKMDAEQQMLIDSLGLELEV